MGEVEPLTDRAPFKPSRTQLTSAVGKWVPDVIVPHLRVLFCGINPGLYSAATGHHFARPGNRFWRALHGAGFTRRLLSPWEEPALLKCGYGVTNLVARATASADEIDAAELVTGRRRLLSKVRRYAPACVASKAVRSSLRRRARQTAQWAAKSFAPSAASNDAACAAESMHPRSARALRGAASRRSQSWRTCSREEASVTAGGGH